MAAAVLWSRRGVIDPPHRWQVRDPDTDPEVAGESVTICTAPTVMDAEAIRLQAIMAEGAVDMEPARKAKAIWERAMRRAGEAGKVMTGCEHARLEAVKEAVRRATGRRPGAS